MSDKISKKHASLLERMTVKVKQFKESGALLLPQNYSPETALKQAGLILAEVKDKNNKPALEVCSSESIGNSLLKMISLGLNPMRHCSFTVYGNKLSCDENYQGRSMRAFRDGGVKSIVSRAVYKSDVVELEIEPMTGVQKIKSHTTKLGNSNSGVVGAYCIITMSDGSFQTTFMDISQIETSWKQSYGGKLSPAHTKFPDEMAKKTVIKRALKPILESLDDKSLFSNDGSENKDFAKEEIQQEIESTDYVDFEEIEEATEKKQTDPVQEVQPEEEDPF